MFLKNFLKRVIFDVFPRLVETLFPCKERKIRELWKNVKENGKPPKVGDGYTWTL